MSCQQLAESNLHKRLAVKLQGCSASRVWPAKICSLQDSQRILAELGTAQALSDNETIDEPCGGINLTLTVCSVPPEDVALAKPCDESVYKVYAGYIVGLEKEVAVIEAPSGRFYTDSAFMAYLRQVATA